MNRLWSTTNIDVPVADKSLEVYLSQRPDEGITSETFGTRYVKVATTPDLGSDNVLVRVLYVSADPAMRGWLGTRRSYVKPVAIGAVMRAMGLGIIARCATRSLVGRLVMGPFGWCEYTVVPTSKLQFVRIPRGLSPTTVLGVLGTTGLTAYFGLLHVGKLQKNEVVVVSAAAGATGSVVAQIAKIYGCFVVGIAGGPDKCAYLEKKLGIVAVDYKSEDGVNAGLKQALGDKSIDVYFDNVGGNILEAALKRLSIGARIVVCGGISSYNSKDLPPGPRNYLALISSRASMTGFLLYDFEEKFPQAVSQLGKWIVAGKIVSEEDETVGLQNAPEALQRLFQGKNTGKVIIRVSEEAEGICKNASARL